jgi:hypothetical protein
MIPRVPSHGISDTPMGPGSLRVNDVALRWTQVPSRQTLQHFHDASSVAGFLKLPCGPCRHGGVQITHSRHSVAKVL